MSKLPTIKERLATLEEKTGNIEQDVHEIRKDVKALLTNNATNKGRLSVWDRILHILIAGVVGGLSGKLWR